MMMSTTLISLIAYNAFLFGVSLYALVRGDRPERIGALIVVSASLLSAAVRLIGITSWNPREIVVPAIDLATMGGFFWLAIRTTRFWPVWCFGFLLANVFVTVAGALMPHISWFFYESGVVIYAYLTIGAIGLGAYRASKAAPRDPENGFR